MKVNRDSPVSNGTVPIYGMEVLLLKNQLYA